MRGRGRVKGEVEERDRREREGREGRAGEGRREERSHSLLPRMLQKRPNFELA